MAVFYYALCSLAAVKAHLDLTGTGRDALLESLIDDATDAIEKEGGGRRLYSKDEAAENVVYTEYYDGDGNRQLLTKHWPIIAVTSLHDDPERVYGADTLISADDYAVKTWAVVLSPTASLLASEGLKFQRGVNNIKIVYTAGYPTIPGGLRRACIQLVSYWFGRRKNEALSSANISEAGGLGNQYERDVPPFIQRLIDPYRDRKI